MKRKIITPAITIILSIAIASTGCCKKGSDVETSPEVRNIILMIGDGMGIAQLTSLTLAEGHGQTNIERATVGGLIKTHSANNRVTDSAAAATAYSTGEKTNNGYLGVDPAGDTLETIIEKAEKAGIATGLVATTLIQHATPAAFYAHNPDRDAYYDIALDLVSSGVDVTIGGGVSYMTSRADGRNLAEEMRAGGYVFAESLEGLDGVTGGKVVMLYDEGGIPKYIREGRDPMLLAKGTIKALEILTTNTDAASGTSTSAASPATSGLSATTSSAAPGFFLMVEGSWIDSAGHDNDPERVLDEMLDFDNAVGVAFDYADTHPGTLVLVVADHETGGLTLPSGDSNFLSSDSGVDFKWSTDGHTGTMIPMFAYGAGAHTFGDIVDNTEVNLRMEKLLGFGE